MAYERILVPVDFSESSQQACAQADMLARASGANLELLHVYPYTSIMVGEFAYATPPEKVAEHIEATEKALKNLAAGLQSAADKVRIQVETGDVIERICERAKKADLIVMGTHGRRGLSHLMMGSVAERVVRQAPVSVLIAR